MGGNARSARRIGQGEFGAPALDVFFAGVAAIAAIITARKSPSARLNRPAAGQHEGAAPAGTVRLTAPGQVRWSIEGSETVVWMNTDGDLAADAAIRIAGAPLPGIDHFLL